MHAKEFEVGKTHSNLTQCPADHKNKEESKKVNHSLRKKNFCDANNGLQQKDVLEGRRNEQTLHIFYMLKLPISFQKCF
jgi:hypothetical protein